MPTVNEYARLLKRLQLKHPQVTVTHMHCMFLCVTFNPCIAGTATFFNPHDDL